MLVTWAGFIILIALLVGLDLGLLSRRPGVVGLKQSLLWSGLWFAAAIGFALVIYDGYEHHRLGMGTVPDAIDGRVNVGTSASAKYLTGYVLEEALSIDNLFVMAVIFRFLAVPAEHQRRVLFWGIGGVLIFRGAAIGAGVELLRHPAWVRYLLGGLLVMTGQRLLSLRDRPPDVAHNVVLRAARRLLPLTTRLDGARFTTMEAGRRALTPLALALVLVETSDIAFAADSIPAVFAVTDDPLLVFTSNIFAVLGLRSLYFALAGLIERFRYVKPALSLILILIGGKMLAGPWLRRGGGAGAGDFASLGLLAVVAVLLAAAILASLVWPTARTAEPRERVYEPTSARS